MVTCVWRRCLTGSNRWANGGKCVFVFWPYFSSLGLSLSSRLWWCPAVTWSQSLKTLFTQIEPPRFRFWCEPPLLVFLLGPEVSHLERVACESTRTGSLPDFLVSRHHCEFCRPLLDGTLCLWRALCSFFFFLVQSGVPGFLTDMQKACSNYNTYLQKKWPTAEGLSLFMCLVFIFRRFSSVLWSSLTLLFYSGEPGQKSAVFSSLCCLSCAITVRFTSSRI